MTIAEIKKTLELVPSIVVPEVSGVITNIMPPKTGISDNGSWKIQGGKLTDETGEINMSLKNRDELPPSFQDQFVTFKSTQTTRGLMGIKAQKRSYVDNKGETRTVLELSITKTAVLEAKGSFTEKEPNNTVLKDSHIQTPIQEQKPHQTPLKPKLGALLRESAILLADEELSGLLGQAVGQGWTSEDVIALAIALYAQGK